MWANPMLWNRSCLHFLVRFVHPHLSTYIWFCKKWVTYCHEHFNIYFFLLHMNFFLILQIISSGHFQQNQLYSHCLLSLSLSSLEPSRLHLQKFLHFFFPFFHFTVSGQSGVGVFLYLWKLYWIVLSSLCFFSNEPRFVFLVEVCCSLSFWREVLFFS